MMLREVTAIENFQQLLDFVVFQIFLCLAIIAKLFDFYGRVGGLCGICIPGEEGLQISNVIVDGGCTDSLGEVPPPCRIIGNGAILCSVKGIFSAFLQTANIMADGGFQDLLWLCDF